MRVCLVIRSLERAGAERQFCLLARGLQARGHEVLALTYYPGGAFEAELDAAKVPRVCLHKKGFKDFAAFIRAVRAIRRFRPDLIHGYMTLGNLTATFAAPWTGRVPVVWGMRAGFMDLAAYGIKEQAAFRLERILSRGCSGIICNAEASRAYLAGQGFPDRAMTVIPNGIDTDFFAPDPAGRALRSAWGIGAQDILVGTVGRVDHMKDHRTFLAMAALASARLPALRFACIGDADPEALGRLQEYGRSLGLEGKVLWLPPRTDLPAVYSALDIFVSSSIGEGFSNVIAEAMACGVPCAVTDVGDSALIVGETGRVAPPRDPEALAAAVLELAQDRGGPGGAAIRARIEANYSIGRMLDRTEHYLGSLARAVGKG